jgi:hypothetical protein
MGLYNRALSTGQTHTPRTAEDEKKKPSTGC